MAQMTPEEFGELLNGSGHVFLYQGKVYVVNVEELMHPGGREVLDENKGKDITKLFEGEGGHSHSRAAISLLERYCRGSIPQANGLKEVKSNYQPSLHEHNFVQHNLVDEGKPLLSQVSKLQPHLYEAWVSAPSPGHPTMFDSLVLERLTSAPWYTVPLIWLPVAMALAWVSHTSHDVSIPLLMVLFTIGVLVWQLFEYSVHRWLFHFVPTDAASVRLHFLLHGHHHKYPMDFDRLVFPPAPAAAVASLWYVVVTAILPQGIAYGLLAGGIVGYVLYDTTHWALHSGAFTPAMLDRKLKSAHMRHHYQDATSNFGISSRLYDSLFGTLAKAKQG